MSEPHLGKIPAPTLGAGKLEVFRCHSTSQKCSVGMFEQFGKHRTVSTISHGESSGFGSKIENFYH